MIVVSFYAPRFEKYEGVDYDELLFLLDKSCKRLDFKHMVISDKVRPKPLNTYLTYLPENLMEAFFYGQGRLLFEIKEPVLFVGADCLLTRDPRPFFLNDLTITTSDYFSDCKMNTGAIFVKETYLCAEIWEKIYESKPKEWGDDQIYLYKELKKSKLKITKIPCEEHNWAPRDIDDDANMPTVVHFRGRRKRFMKEWAKKYLNLD